MISSLWSEPKWHEGEGWHELLTIYDQRVEKLFQQKTCRIVNSNSRFGTTRLYDCGVDSKDVVFLLHGSNENSTLWAEWGLVQKLVDNNYRVVCIDTIGDMGRSLPKDGLTSSVPQGEEETVEWFLSLKSELGLKGTPVSLVGASHGSFLASVFSKDVPKEVDKVIYTAPAAVFLPLRGAVVWGFAQWFIHFLWRNLPTTNMKIGLMKALFRPMLGENADRMETDYPPFDWQSRIVKIENVNQVIAGQPHEWTVDELKEMNRSNPSLLLIGESDVVIDPVKAVQIATQAGIPSKTYPKGCHMLWFPTNAEEEAQDILTFLVGKDKVNGVTYPS